MNHRPNYKSQNYKVSRREYKRNFSSHWGKNFLENVLQEMTINVKAMRHKILPKISTHQIPPSRT